MLDLALTRFSPEDVEGMIALDRLHYGQNDVSFPEHFRWKYLQSPHGPAHIWLCKDMSRGGVIVGKLVGVLRKVCAAERPVLASLVTNILVHPDYRGRRIVSSLGRALFDDCEAAGLGFSYSLPNPSAHYALAQRLGMLTIGHIPLLLKPINLLALNSRMSGIPLRDKLLWLTQAFYATSGWVDRGRERGPSALVVREIERFDGAFDEFWIRVRHKRPVMIRRTAEYLQWRFGVVPRRVYRKWIVSEGDELRGYVVARIMEIGNTRSGMIADLLVEDSSVGLEAGSLLISAITDWFKTEEVALSGCLMLPGTNEFRLLRRRGYLVCPRRLKPHPFLVVTELHQASLRRSPVQDIGNWFFTMGDYDVV